MESSLRHVLFGRAHFMRAVPLAHRLSVPARQLHSSQRGIRTPFRCPPPRFIARHLDQRPLQAALQNLKLYTNIDLHPSWMDVLPPIATILPSETHDVLPGRSWLSWTPSSKAELREAEKRMLSIVRTPLVQRMVTINNGAHHINTINTHPSPNKPTLVLVHGFAAGIGFWAKNIDALAEHYNVYAFDLLGFGRSSRPRFTGTTPDEAEHFWVDSIEDWRRQVGLEHFHLLGHSLGGFITGCYALSHPERVQHLLLCDPAGVPKRQPSDVGNDPRGSWTFRALTSLAWRGGLLSPVRLAGPWGPGLIERLRGDLSAKFPHQDNTVATYLYHLLAQEASGEHVFTALFQPFTWAHNPLVDRLHQVRVKNVTFIYGNMTWMDPRPAFALQETMQTHNVCVHRIGPAGHHVYADAADHFHQLVADCRMQRADRQQSPPSPRHLEKSL